jgi:hypothetical protein
VGNKKKSFSPGKKNLYTKLVKKDIKGKLFWERTWEYETANKIPAVKMYLPNCRIEYFAASAKGGASQQKAKGFTAEDGSFEFKNVPIYNAYIKILLEHKDGKVTKIEGLKNDASETHFEVKKNKVIWGRVDLDPSALSKPQKTIDLGEVKIAHAKFAEVCDMYGSIYFGHKKLKKLTGEYMPFVKILYPQSGSASFYRDGVGIHILKGDVKDRAVILHEYGHFIITHKIGSISAVISGMLYDYNDDSTNTHTPKSKEYIESAWNEGIATFLSCAMMDNHIYHDGYDTNLTMDLEKDMIKVGAHCEGSIQGALWHVYKKKGADFKDHIWEALTNKTKRTVRTVWQFYDNWKDLKLTKLSELQSALKDHGMEYRYDYLTGTERYICVAAPKTFNKKNKEFQTINELYDNFGKVGGGTPGIYKEEFYNRNKKFNSGSLDSGSTYTNPKVTKGKRYIVPYRSKVS